MQQDTIEMTTTDSATPIQHKPLMVQQSSQLSTADNLLQIAVQRGASMEELERLMALKERIKF